jgi:apolipoprotein N-acyltransferase
LAESAAGPATTTAPRHSRKERSVRAALSFVSGLAVAVAFPPFDLWPLMFPGLAGLLVVVRGAGGRAALGLGLLFGLGYMLPLLRWITIIGTDAWLGLALLEALFLGLLGWAWSQVRQLPWWPLAAALTWVGAESLRGVVPFGGLPWGSLPFGLVDTPLVRYGRLGGTALVSFVVVLAVALVVWAVENRGRRTPAVGALTGAIALAGISLLVPVGAAGPIGTVQVAAVQGDVPGEGLDPFAERRQVLHNHAAATRELAAEVAAGDRAAPDVVIWPENSTDIDPYSDQAAFEEIDAAVRAIGAPTLVGAVVDGPDDEHVQNMGIVWDPRTGPGAQYVKRHPVPFGEYIPFRSVLSGMIERLDQIPRDFYQGERPGVLDLGPVRIGDVICFEVVYDGLIRDVVDGGGQLLVVQTNNATYAGTGQLEQQFAISRYRAVETGRTVVVAATNGISGIIAPDGEVLQQSEVRTRALLSAEVALADGRTAGVRFGHWVELVLALGGGLAVAYAVWARRRPVGRMVT